MQPGDVVVLKSGSDPMTIVDRNSGGDEWKCIWWTSKTDSFNYQYFPEAALQTYNG
ncbi:DUF2158 domain-containing protein [Lysobacter sp. HA35]